MFQLVNDVSEQKFDELIFDDKIPFVTKSVVLKQAQGVLQRGTVLGIVTATGEAVAVDSTKADGSEKADCILADTIDTTDGAVTYVAYASGRFNRKALILGGTDTAEDHEQRLRELGIYLKDKM
ncbi:head decoration protein [Exiguobacterium sp. s142]|jgi:hypothetical protein|uniref:head decoration protein n=1 Tax=Exiguobacterium sp. s142 TaxID=2751222 RepID=UPI001BE94988|nr:head decoration protein [Exiguobacterium sp. s142]